MINYQNIAKKCGVSGPTIKEYFQILESTLIGRFIPVFRKQIKRRLVSASRFVFFDMGVVNLLTRRGTIHIGSALFGKAFEHFITLEIITKTEYITKNIILKFPSEL
jgi:predicted AAA+ superfamily ATPase